MPQILNDWCGVFDVQKIEEASKSASGRTELEGTFQRSDMKNENGRTYQRGLWETVLAEDGDVQKMINNRQMVGQLGHPEDGVTNEENGALLVTELTLKEDGVVFGRAEVLSSPKGKILETYVNDKVRIGVSSRGVGSVGTDGIVQEDYQLRTFDAVFNPSTKGAYPTAEPLKSKSTSEDKDPERAVPSGKTRSEPSPAPEPAPQLATVTEARDTMKNHVDKIRGIETRIKQTLRLKAGTLEGYHLEEACQRLEEATKELVVLSSESDPGPQGIANSLIARIETKRAEMSEWADAPSRMTNTVVPEEDKTSSVNEDDMKAQLKEAQEQVVERDLKLEGNRKLIEGLSSKLKGTKDELAEAVESNRELEEKVAASIELIRSLREYQEQDTVKTAVESILVKHPSLVPVRALIESCVTADAVHEAANNLLTLGGAGKPDSTLPVPGTQPGSIVETDSNSGNTALSTPVEKLDESAEEGAKHTAALLEGMFPAKRTTSVS